MNSATCLDDVPSPIDLQDPDHAAEWAATALDKRPWRPEFFARFAEELRRQDHHRPLRVLELGSGPGFLAEHLLAHVPALHLDLLDFSAAMHELARSRLMPQWQAHLRFVQASFRSPDWMSSLQPGYDFVVTNQAVHELRHKRHAATLHAQVRGLLAPDASYLVCDHFCGEGGMRNEQLYMSVDEQRQALQLAGFPRVDELLCKGGMVLHRARCG